MKTYLSLGKEELSKELDLLKDKYNDFLNQNLKFDMSRGKPGAEQLDLSNSFADCVTSANIKPVSGADYRNYGIPEGISEAREIMAKIMECEKENIYIGGGSSLSMMYDIISYAYCFGLPKSEKPWCREEKVKFLCPTPGYDRHFAITEKFGFELVLVDMTENGPDMDMVENLVRDPSVKGIWNVPKYSNPTGITYSDDVVKRFAALNPAAPDFIIIWDNAYLVHDLDTENPDKLLNLLDEACKNGKEDMVFTLASSAKMIFPGSGISALAASINSIKWFLSHKSIQTICNDKIMQLGFARFFPDLDSVTKHMAKQAKILRPKFEAVLNALENLRGLEIAQWTKPNGGYFLSIDVLPGCAKRVVALCKEAGVVLTPAGASYPYGTDPKDKNIRFAPTFPSIDELKIASELFVLCIKIAACEKLLST